MGLTTPSCKKNFVTETRTVRNSTFNILGDDGASDIERMMARGQSREDSTGLKPLSSNKPLRIASWNVRTMYEAGKCHQVLTEMKRYRLHILGISESHWIQSGQKRLGTGEHILYSSREEKPHREGVALIISKQAWKTFRGWEAHGPRILWASFSTGSRKVNINIVQIYAPTNDAEDEDKDDFYGRLQGVMDRLPAKDVNIVMGDANAKVGEDPTGYETIMGRHGLGTMNENGERFAEFCSINGLTIGGTIFPHKQIHKATWRSPDGKTENQIDHICISSKFRRSLQDVKVARGADVASDHHLLLATLKLKLKSYNRTNPSKRPKYEISHLQGRKKEEFKITLRNRFEPLQLLEDDVETHWEKVREVFTSTCMEVLGEKTQVHKEWITQETLDKIEVRRNKKAKVNDSRTRAERESAQIEYTRINKEVKKCIRKDKETYMNELADDAERAAQNGHLRVLYQSTKRLSGKWGRAEMPVKDAQGKTIFEKEAQLERWKEHFETLLNRPAPDNPPDINPSEEDLPISCEPPTREEIAKAVRLLNSNKAAGPDSIPPEALKADVPTTVDILYNLFIKVWEEEDFPTDWREGHLVKLPKKGDLSNCNNYRGITLLSIPGKVFNRILLERIKEATDKQLRDNQAGFRKYRSCTDQVATLRLIVEQSLEWNSPLLVNFIDYEKAFDSIDRQTLWKIMRHYGIPQKIVSLIEEMYKDTTCRVLHEGQLTDSFNINTGVRQGCLLSPFLFILAIDWIMKVGTEGRRNGIQWTLWEQLDDLDFADDIALLSHSQQQLQSKTTALDELSASVGLRIHPGKSKVLRVHSANREPIMVKNQALEEVNTFTYLGSVVDEVGGTEADIKARISKARFAFISLGKVWKDRTISTKTKCRLFSSNVKSILLYGCETWKLTKTLLNKLQTFVNTCLRKILRIRWPDRIRNEELWERTGQKAMSEELGQRKWRWLGHTLRKPPGNITRHSLTWNPQGQRKRGRPRTTWRRCIEEDMKRGGYSWSGLQKIAQDRDGWRAVVRGLYPGQG